MDSHSVPMGLSRVSMVVSTNNTVDICVFMFYGAFVALLPWCFHGVSHEIFMDCTHVVHSGTKYLKIVWVHFFSTGVRGKLLKISVGSFLATVKVSRLSSILGVRENY